MLKNASCSLFICKRNIADANVKLSSAVSLLFMKIFHVFELHMNANLLKKSVKIVFVLKAQYQNFFFKVTLSTLHHQYSCIKDEFENHRVVFCWSIVPKNIGMRLLPLRAVSVRKI